MSKPELPVDPSLDEILATIRKTLGDDRPEDGLSKLDSLPPGVRDEPAAPAKGNGAGALPDRLADALGGGHSEEDLTDLLATELPSPTQAPKPQSGADTRDAPWFLSRGSLPDAPEAKPAASNTQVDPGLPNTAHEEIMLTRPETLRRSFPPLFGAGEATPTRPADMPFERPKPNGLAGLPASRTAEAPVLPTPAVADRIVPAALPAKQGPAAEPAKFVAPIEAKARPVEERVAPFVEKPAVLPELPNEISTLPEPPRNVRGPEASVPPRPEFGTAMPEPPRPEPPRPEPPRPETPRPEPVAERAAGLQGQPLQEMIARLLEPVIQQWLDQNLPSMVEAAIREEMDRQFKRPRGELKN
jgi:cell pole-organizing protein PopZ